MAKKDTATSEAQALDLDATAPGQATAGTTAAEGNTSGFYIYMGPTLKGVIQAHTIYRGTRADALTAAAAAIEHNHLVKNLIVAGDALPAARQKLKTPGNALYANYRKLAGKA